MVRRTASWSASLPRRTSSAGSSGSTPTAAPGSRRSLCPTPDRGMALAIYPADLAREVTLSRRHPRAPATDPVRRCAAAQALHARLSRQTIYQRFFGAVPRLPTSWASLLDRGGLSPAAGTGARAGVGGESELIGVGRYEPTAEPDTAEVAFVVEDRWQGKGLGTVLFTALLAAARGSRDPSLPGRRARRQPADARPDHTVHARRRPRNPGRDHQPRILTPTGRSGHTQGGMTAGRSRFEVVIGTDGSASGQAAVDAATRFPWPARAGAVLVVATRLLPARHRRRVARGKRPV